jgi:hypothetical protein
MLLCSGQYIGLCDYLIYIFRMTPMKITGPLCPLNKDGRHKPKLFYGKTSVRGNEKRSGAACRDCHMTWWNENGDMVKTY